jgi:trypsin
MQSTHLFEALAVRLSRRTATRGLWVGLVALAVQDGRRALARERANTRKKGRTDGRKQRPKKKGDGGQAVTPKIVGGVVVPEGTYPFHVALTDSRFGENGVKTQFCAGSLIDAWHVLTAAHCVKGRATTHPRNLQVLIGVTDLKSPPNETRRIATITIHPDYKAKTFRNDAAVLRLDAPVDLATYPAIRPASARDAGLEAPGTVLTATGWGDVHQHVAGKKRRNKPPKYSPVLRDVQVPVVADEECLSHHGGQDQATFVPAAMICVGKRGRDACSGDSGGPLFAETPEGFVQVGIVSWGRGCGAPKQPGIYTRVSAIADFIQSVIADAR